MRPDPPVDDEVLGYFREYRWLKAFGGGHEAFMETPKQTVDVLLAIDNRVLEIERDAQRSKR